MKVDWDWESSLVWEPITRVERTAPPVTVEELLETVKTLREGFEEDRCFVVAALLDGTYEIHNLSGPLARSLLYGLRAADANKKG